MKKDHLLSGKDRVNRLVILTFSVFLWTLCVISYMKVRKDFSVYRYALGVFNELMWALEDLIEK